MRLQSIFVAVWQAESTPVLAVPRRGLAEPGAAVPQLPSILALLGPANEPVTGHAAAVLRCCARQGELVHRLEPALPRLMALLREPRPRTSAARQVWASRAGLGIFCRESGLNRSAAFACRYCAAASHGA